MNASDIRGLATQEFMTGGLGGMLTRGARMLITADNDGRLGNVEPVAVSLVCGIIIERTLWIALGRWVGYLEPVPNINDDEKSFLTKHARQFTIDEWPELYANVMKTLLSEDADRLTFGDPLISSELPRGNRDIFPLFQAAQLIAETLTDGPITAFFIFLRYGNVEVFEQHMPSADAVYSFLEVYDFPHNFADGFRSLEAVIAGFIRYTEFLSAMNDLFPFPEKVTIWRKELPENVVLREQLAFEVINLIQWRFPRGQRAFEIYKSVRTSFFKMVHSQLERYPESGLQWSEIHTHAELIGLAYRFFGVAEFEDVLDVEAQDRPTRKRWSTKRFREFNLEEAEPLNLQHGDDDEDDELTTES